MSGERGWHGGGRAAPDGKSTHVCYRHDAAAAMELRKCDRTYARLGRAHGCRRPTAPALQRRHAALTVNDVCSMSLCLHR
eukprot:477020-Alexandrium_andersonii.AAC.1